MCVCSIYGSATQALVAVIKDNRLTRCDCADWHVKVNGGGAIITILSILAKVTLPNLGTYCASKAALLRLCEGVRAELGAQKTGVMAVMPWAVDTPMSGNFQGEKTSTHDVVAGVFKSLDPWRDEVYFHEFTDSINRRLREDPETLVRELGAQFREAR